MEHVGRVRDAVVEHPLEHRKAHVSFDDSRDEPHDPAETVPQVIGDARVVSSRERMRARTPMRVNADLTVAEVRRHCAVDGETEALLAEAVRARRLSARGYHRVLRVARTAADLAASDPVRGEDVALALLLRAEP